MTLFKKKRNNKIKETKMDQIFDVINILILFSLVLLVVLPLINLFSRAFSDGVYNPQVTFYPVKFTFRSFDYVMGQGNFWKSFGNSLIITLIVTVVSNLLMAFAAYPLSKPDLPFRKGVLKFFVITMLFSPGVIPIFLLMSEMKLTDTIWSVILVSLINVFNLLLYKTSFEEMNPEIIEAAKIDGAGNLRLFFNIMLPLSLPVIATTAFFTIVGTWNNYSTALLFISDADAYPLALYIFKMLQQSTVSYDDPWLLINESNIHAASIVVSLVPILIIYPFVVKYIKGGLNVGSVKG